MCSVVQSWGSASRTVIFLRFLHRDSPIFQPACRQWNTACFAEPRNWAPARSPAFLLNKSMPSYVYVARETSSGREIRSAVEAATEQAAIAALLNRNLLVVSIQEKIGKKGRTGGGRVALNDLV